MKKLIIATLLSSGIYVNAAPIVGPIVNPNNGHSYYLLDKDSWPSLEGIAISLGGHLATIRNSEENYWIYGQFINYKDTQNDLWIGLNDIQKDGKYIWSSNEESLYRNWMSGMGGPPDSKSDCAFIENSTGSWSTVRDVHIKDMVLQKLFLIHVQKTQM